MVEKARLEQENVLLKRQRDELLKLVKNARNALQPAPDSPIGPHPLLAKLDTAIAECERKDQGD